MKKPCLVIAIAVFLMAGSVGCGDKPPEIKKDNAGTTYDPTKKGSGPPLPSTSGKGASDTSPPDKK